MTAIECFLSSGAISQEEADELAPIVSHLPSGETALLQLIAALLIAQLP